MTNSECREQFEDWLYTMDDRLDAFIHAYQAQMSGPLDYSAESLVMLEGWLLARYASLEATRPKSEASVLDGAACYVGEVFRLRLGGTWTINCDQPEMVFYRLPQLSGFAGQSSQFCPLSLVSASTSRRTGRFLTMVFDNSVEDAGIERE